MNSLLKDFFKYTGLNIAGMIGLSCYILADTFFVAQALGTDGLAALNFAIAIYTLMNGTGLMLGIGGATVFTIKKETGKNGNIPFMHSLYGGAVAAFVFVIAGLFFSTPLSALMGAEGKALPMCSIYLKVLMLFSPFFILNSILTAFVRNDNSPRLSMTAMLISSFSNIVLDYVFMFPFNMGMFGAVFATCMSPVISIAVLSRHFIKKKNTFFIEKVKLKFSELKNVLIYGFSTFVGELASSIALLVFNLVLMNIGGSTAVAAYGIIANIVLVVISIYNGLAQGTQPLASGYYGKGGYTHLEKLLRYGLVSALVISGAIYAVLFVFAEPIVQVFSGQDQYLKEISVIGVKIYFIGTFFNGINVFLASFLSATSKYGQGMAISILRSSVVLIPAVILLSVAFGINGVWMSFVATELIVCVLSLIFTIRLLKEFKNKAM